MINGLSFSHCYKIHNWWLIARQSISLDVREGICNHVVVAMNVLYS